MIRRADPHRALLKAIAARGIGAVVEAASVDWASALFVGRQHALAIRAGDPGQAARLAAFAAEAEEAEWTLPGHIVASVAVGAFDGETLRLEVLTIED